MDTRQATGGIGARSRRWLVSQATPPTGKRYVGWGTVPLSLLAASWMLTLVRHPELNLGLWGLVFTLLFAWMIAEGIAEITFGRWPQVGMIFYALSKVFVLAMVLAGLVTALRG